MTNEQVIDCRAMEQEEFLLQSREVVSSIALDASTLRQKVYVQVSKLIKELLETNTASYDCIVLTQESNPEIEVSVLNRLQDINGTRAHREARSLLTKRTINVNTPSTASIKYFQMKEKGVTRGPKATILEAFYFSSEYYKRVKEVGNHPFSEKVLKNLLRSVCFQDILKAMGGRIGTYAIVFYLEESSLRFNITASSSFSRMEKLVEVGGEGTLYGHTYYEPKNKTALEEVIL